MKHFVVPVPDLDFPTYRYTVPLPMDFNIIINRVLQGYYRSVEALE
jgi:hypothetical protein